MRCARRSASLVLLVLASCARPRSGAPRPGSDQVGGSAIRVALAHGVAAADFGATGSWMLLDDRRRLLARAAAGDVWRIERNGKQVRAIRSGERTGWIEGPIYAVMSADAFGIFGDRKYRGELMAFASGQGITVVNRIRIDDYLLGVVALEMGGRAAAESAAVQAQAVTARSYAFVHLDPRDARGFDVTASPMTDQAYAGVDAETAVTSHAVQSTRGLVLQYGGRVANAPYSAVCGGETAAQSEIWRTDDVPYLKRVSDRIPGTDRYYCDIAPRFRWTRTFDEAELVSDIARYLASYATVPGGNPGRPRAVVVGSTTPSRRAATLIVTTDRGDFTVRGNDIRYVLRDPSGAILSSTYFSIDSSTQRDGHLTRLILRGGGNGHGVGMCQWGAIGRARAGQTFREILATYYPGTSVGPVR
jgi:stage II sporulation protein D